MEKTRGDIAWWQWRAAAAVCTTAEAAAATSESGPHCMNKLDQCQQQFTATTHFLTHTYKAAIHSTPDL